MARNVNISKVAVAILTHNAIHHLKKFLPSVLAYTREADIYVIDNNSTDGTLSFLKEEFPQVHYIHLDKNYGFAEGYNRGLSKIIAEYYVLLNNDVEVSENWLSPIIKFMDENLDVGALQPKIKSYERREYFEYSGACGGLIDLLCYPYARGRIISYLEKDIGQYDQITNIFWASGACLVVRASLFWAVGGFDHNLGNHMEEIDLCWRIQLSGFRCVVFPCAEVYHLGGGTLPYSSPLKLFYNFRNNIVIIRKNCIFVEMMILRTVRFFVDIFGALSILFKFNLIGFLYALGGIITGQFYKYQEHKLRKRSITKIYGYTPKPVVIWAMLKSIFRL